MERKGLLCVAAIALVCTTAIQTRAAITILSETYTVKGDAFHHHSAETISYHITSSTPPLSDQINQPFDNDGFNEDGPFVLHASSLATRYMDGGDMVFRVEQHPYDSDFGSPTYTPAEAHTAASLQVDFVPGLSLRNLRMKITSQAGPDGQVAASLTDLDTGRTTSFVPDYLFTGVTWWGYGMYPAHTYRLALSAGDTQWAPGSVEVQFLGVPVPLPGAAALVAIGTGLLVWLRRRNALGADRC